MSQQGNTVNVSKIKSYIKENGLTKTEFCKKCEISISAFNRVLTGMNGKLNTLFKIAKEMKIHIHELFC